MIRLTHVLACTALSAGLAFAQTTPQGTAAGQKVPGAKATLKDAKGQDVGDVTLQETPSGVLVKVELRNAGSGVKAFHIHDVGKCEGPGFQSAGPHFSPVKHQHGILNPQGPHAGDLPNAHLAQDGSVSFEVLAPSVTLAEGANGTLFDADGAAVVLHAKADDYATDPSGNAGDRVACGVITR